MFLLPKLCTDVFIAKKDDSTRVDRAQWKGVTNTMSDSTKFVDMLHNVSWEDGLPEDVLRGNDWLWYECDNILKSLKSTGLTLI